MKWQGPVLFLLGSQVIFLAVLLKVPVPNDYQQPWSLRLQQTVLRSLFAIGDVLESLCGVHCRIRVFRKLLARMAEGRNSQLTNHLRTRDEVFDGVPVRLYIPDETSSNAAVVFYHGGWWTMGSVDLYDHIVKAYATELGIVFISVEYRLAPEYIFPAPLDDCVRATRHLISNAEKYNISANSIAVMGDSAGGTLAASVTQRLRDDNIRPALQILIYPCLQAINFNTKSYTLYGGNIFGKHTWAQAWLLYAFGEDSKLNILLNNEHLPTDVSNNVTLQHLNLSYLSHNTTTATTNDPAIWQHFKETFLDPQFAPLMAEHFSLPSTLVVTVEQDVCRDDGVMYAERLQAANNDVTHVHYAAGYHGLFTDPESVDGKLFARQYLKFIKENL